MDPLIGLFGQVGDDEEASPEEFDDELKSQVEDKPSKEQDTLGDPSKQESLTSSNLTKGRSNNRGSMVNNFRKASYKGPVKYLPPEPTEGNIEYKLKLINPSQSRFEHLVTQMKWRLREGKPTEFDYY